MTKKEMFAEITNVAIKVGRQDIIEFCSKEVELLNKRSSKESKAAKAKAEEREALARQIVNILEGAAEPLKTMEIANQLGVSPQKTTPIMKALLEKGEVIAEKIKGTTFYSVAV